MLKAEFPGGVDVVYESVGGEMFGVCVKALARFGRCVVIGMMSQYRNAEGQGWEGGAYPGLTERLLWKSQTVVRVGAGVGGWVGGEEEGGVGLNSCRSKNLCPSSF